MAVSGLVFKDTILFSNASVVYIPISREGGSQILSTHGAVPALSVEWVSSAISLWLQVSSNHQKFSF